MNVIYVGRSRVWSFPSSLFIYWRCVWVGSYVIGTCKSISEKSKKVALCILKCFWVWIRLNPMRFLLSTIFFLFLLTPFIHGQSSEKPCYISLNSSGEFNQVLLSNISTSLISQYIRQVKQIPSGGLSGSDHCIYEVSVTKDIDKTFCFSMSTFVCDDYIDKTSIRWGLKFFLLGILKNLRIIKTTFNGVFLVEKTTRKLIDHFSY